VLLACAFSAVGAAAAFADPNISSPSQGAYTGSEPSFSGTSGDELDDVTLSIYAGGGVGGSPVESVSTLLPPLGGEWSLGASSPLGDSEYTAVAEQTNVLLETSVSAPVSFIVDTTKPSVGTHAVDSPTDDPTPTIEGNGGTASGDDGSVEVTLHFGGSVGGTVAAGPQTVNLSGGHWQMTAPHLGDGLYTVEAIQRDEAGNVGEATPVSFTVDTTAPAPSIDAVASPTSDDTPTLEGGGGTAEGDDGSVAVTIHQGGSVGGSVVASHDASLSGGHWSWTAPTLSDGTYTVQAVQGDDAGNEGEAQSVTFTVDATPPSVSIDSVPSPSKDSTPTLEGSAGTSSADAHSVTVTIRDASNAIVSGPASVPVNGGHWSSTPSALADGTYTAQVTQSDEAGETAEDSTGFTIDTTAPVPSIDAVSSPTSDSTPTLEGGGGTANGDNPSVTVTIHQGSSVSGSVVASHDASLFGGHWSWTAPTLSDGTYTVQATQSDDVGNKGEASSVTFTVDATPPSVSIDSVPSPSKDSTPTLEGSAGSSSGDAHSVTVTIRNAGNTIVSGPTSVPVSGGHWSSTPSALADGTYTAQVTQSDEAGETAEDSTGFTIDTTAPTVTLNPIASPTKDSTPSMSGTAGGATGDSGTVHVTIHQGSSVGGTVIQSGETAVGGGEWAYTATHLADGIYTVQVQQKDEVGNVGEATPRTFVLDTSGPAVSIEAIASPGRNSSPTLKGGAGSGGGDSPTVVFTIHQGGSVGGLPVLGPEPVAVSAGKWAASALALPDGTYTAQVTQADEAGNESEASTTFTIDTTPPAPSIQQLSSPTGNPTPTVSGAAGTANGDGATVAVTVHAGAAGGNVVAGPTNVSITAGNWKYTAPHLADGSYTVQVAQSDQAGNVGEATPMSFVVNTAVPAVTIAPLATPSNHNSPKLEGSAGTRGEDHPEVSVTLDRGVEPVLSKVVKVEGGGTWALPLSNLPDGEYTATATQEDEEGITGIASRTFVIDTTKPLLTVDAVGKIGHDPTPTLEGAAGTAPGDKPVVKVTIRKGATTVAQGEAHVAGAAWTYTTPTLVQGKYVASITQSDTAGNTSEVTSEEFTVDTEAPKVKLEHPTGNNPEPVARPIFSGTRGDEEGDEHVVTISIYQGTSPTGTPLVSEEVQAHEPHWEQKLKTPLPSGFIYTAVAEQRDEAGNVGRSEVQFKVFTDDSPTVAISTEGFAARDKTLYSGSAVSFSGTAGLPVGENGAQLEIVVQRVETGHAVGAVAELEVPIGSGGEWAAGPINLPEGEYRIEAEQEGPKEAGHGLRAFDVDSQPPAVTLTTPGEGSTSTSSTVPVAGAAGTAPGDAATVTIDLYAGGSTATPPINAITVPINLPEGAWSGSFGGLAPGTYTVRAQQGDDVGNVGLSTPATFTVGAVPPVASFKWIPAKPHVGEQVSLVSTSTDAVNAITAFAWDVLGTGPFKTGESVLSTKFTTAGSHVVRLQVTDAVGASATISETIPVAKTATVLMSPFPIVRIAGSETAAGARITLLTVQAPLGAKISIACKGKGCPTRSITQLATLSKRKGKAKQGTVLIPFKRFERGLRAGVTLEIRVTKNGQIGKYTRFAVRQGKLPRRVDMCLAANGVKAIICPTS
jgi:major membrane immunogen (membrane-anchored lipoprotein)